jgi:hypothetical protein
MHVSSNKGFDISFSLSEKSDYESKIVFFDGSLIHHSLELKHRSVIFGDDEKSARIFIETMNESWSLDT